VHNLGANFVNYSEISSYHGGEYDVQNCLLGCTASVKRLLSRVEVHVSCSQFVGVLRKFAFVSVCVTLFDTALKCIRISVDGYI
jgi:hypothetical protein